MIYYFAGEFGVVYKGMLKKGRANEVVAVKSLKGIYMCVRSVRFTLPLVIINSNILTRDPQGAILTVYHAPPFFKRL